MYVYRVGYIRQIDSIFRHGYSRQFLGDNEGTDYGDGIYCNIDIRDSLNRLRYTNGGCLFKCKILSGLHGYLIFNEKYAQETYGGSYSIKDQAMQLFGEDAKKVWRDFTNIMNGDYSAREHMHGRTSELLQVLLSPRRIGKLKSLLPIEDSKRNVRKEYEKLFKKHNIKGAIYRGLKDGLCLVSYDFSDCIPVAYSTDGGRTFKERKFEGDNVDVKKKYGLKYKDIDYQVHIYCGDKEYEFSRVLKKNGKWNYIDVKSGDEFSPIDFDSATLINKDNGMFQIEYNGQFFDACPDGFFDESGEGHTFDELSKFGRMSEQEQRFEQILENALQEVYKRFTSEKPLINENILKENAFDEVKYGDYEVPTEEELESTNFVSVYHVTSSSVVDNIFKFQCDREFKCKNANAFGAGVYTTISVDNARKLLGSTYGDAIIQMKVIGGFDKFLIFNQEIARKHYGNKCDILDQLKTWLKPSDAEKLFSRNRYDVKGYSKVANKYGIRGAIYNWNGCIAVLPFDFSTLVPYAVSYDRGKTFQKKYNTDTANRILTSVDVDYRYGDIYSFTDKAIEGYNKKGEKTGFARVKKHNGKWNYIDIQDDSEISPIDFDSVTLMNPDNGDLQIEYKGVLFDACLDGFFDENGEGHTFDELPNFV